MNAARAKSVGVLVAVIVTGAAVEAVGAAAPFFAASWAWTINERLNRRAVETKNLILILVIPSF
jgi:hypothetical protein